MSLFQRARNLFNDLRKDFSPDGPTPEESFRSAITQAMPFCPVCKQKTEGHDYQQIACTPLGVGKEESLQAMMDAMRLHQWEVLDRFHEWEGLAVNADVFLLRCSDGRFNLVLFWDPFELEDVWTLIRHEELGAQDLPILLGPWEQF